MDSAGNVAVGSDLRERLARRNPVPVLAVAGVALVVAGLVVPTVQTLLFAWGGTALFAAGLVQFVTTTPTVPATVAGDLHHTRASNVRQLVGNGESRYVPGDEAVRLAVEGTDAALDPVGERLLTTTAVGDGERSPDDVLAVLSDALVNELELVGQVECRRTDDGAEVTVTDARLDAAEPFDHPVGSVFGVGLARGLDTTVTVATSTEGEGVVFTCEWDA